MVGVVIRAAEGCAAETNALWDTQWDAERGVGDWQLARGADPANVGGLRATAAIETAVILALFTDKRIAETHPLVYLADGDRRGFWGDGVDVRDDLNEAELGSHLWLLERAPLTVSGQPITQWAEQFAIEALAPLKAQGVCVRIDVRAEADELKQRLDLFVQLYGRDGSRVFDRAFDVLWQQVPR